MSRYNRFSLSNNKSYKIPFNIDEIEIDGMQESEIDKIEFDKKMEILNFLKDILSYGDVLNETEKTQIKSKIFEIINTFDFNPELFKNILLTEKIQKK